MTDEKHVPILLHRSALHLFAVRLNEEIPKCALLILPEFADETALSLEQSFHKACQPG